MPLGSRSARCGRVLLILLLLTLPLSGCWDRRDPEKMVWVTAVGIDKGRQGDYLFSFQIPGPSGGGKGSQPPGGQQGPGASQSAGATMDVFAIEAPDIVTALDASQSFVARRISLTHAKTVVIGEELASEDVTPVLAGATRYHEFRRNMSVMVSRGSAYEFMRRAQPKLETNASRWYESLMLTQAQAGIVPETHLHDFVIDTETQGSGAKATLVAWRPDISAGQGELPEPPANTADGGAPPTAGNAKAGEVRRLEEVPVEFMGAAIFKGAKMQGMLTGDESRFESMLRGEFKHAGMAFVDPASPDRRLVLRLKPEGPPGVQVTRQGNRVRAAFQVRLEGDLVSVHSETDYSKSQQLARLEESAAREIEQRMSALLSKALNEWGTDLFHIGSRLRPTFATVQEWEQFDWGRRVYDTSFSVDVRVRVRRYGLQAAPATPRR